MAIYYTIKGGNKNILRFDKTSRHKIILKNLKTNGKLFGIAVDSVFFTKNGYVTRVYDVLCKRDRLPGNWTSWKKMYKAGSLSKLTH